MCVCVCLNIQNKKHRKHSYIMYTKTFILDAINLCKAWHEITESEKNRIL